jgi:hypothetical protein
MTLGESLISVWRQARVEKKAQVTLEGKSYPVTRTRGRKLLTVEFQIGPYRIVGIEQNPQTGSRWSLLAQQGKHVMQFRCKGRHIGNVCEEQLLRYPAWQALQLRQ